MLENDSKELEVKHSELCGALQETERHINVIKERYAEMVASTQSLKSQIESVQTKCDRSLKIGKLFETVLSSFCSLTLFYVLQ